MNLSEFNLDINTYTEERLKKSFALNDNYTHQDVINATQRMSEVVNKNLSNFEKSKFNDFINQSKNRLLKNTISTGYLETNELLPTNRQLTILPGEQKDNMSHQLMFNSKEENSFLPLPTPPSKNENNYPKTKISRIISIDSQYRQNISILTPDGQRKKTIELDSKNISYNTNFMINFPEPLTNVVSIKLYSVQIPTTWYTFDTHLGNTVYKHNSSTDMSSIEIGNYDISGLCNQLVDLSATASINDQKIKFNDTNNIISYDSDFSNSFINQNLFWNLGFRKEINESGDISFNITSGDKSDVPVDVYGPKYFVLNIDDFNKNSQGKGFLNITDTFEPISVVNTSRRVLPGRNNRILTNNEKRSQNAILNKDISGSDIVRYNNKRTSNKNKSTNSFAIIPLKDVISLRARQEPVVEFGKSLEHNIRVYSGPVNIERLQIQLLDDKGNLVNLHDNDWSFSLIVEQLI